MTTDLVIRDSGQQGNSLEVKMRYAQAMAQAGLLPKAYRNQPANLLIAIELGQALGIPTIQAVNDIHVIDGKPSASANLIAAMIRKAGHKLRITTTSNPPSARAELRRADDPDFPYVSEWNVEKAETAELLERDRQGKIIKDNWRKYPEQMMRARAITEVARDGASDVLYGVVYTPEELEVSQLPDAELAELEHEAARKRMGWLMKQGGYDKAAGLAFAAHVLGHDVESSDNLTRPELDMINAELEKANAPDDDDSAADDESHIEDAVVVDESTSEVTPADLPEEMITERTQRRQRAQRAELDMKEDEPFWEWLEVQFGRPFTSSKEQTEAEAREACARMQIMVDAARQQEEGEQS